MTIFDKRLSEYLTFTRLTLVLIPVVGFTRLALSLSGVPNSAARWLSITAIGFLGVLYYSIRIHLTGFGSYKQLLVVCTLQNWMAQAVAISGILLAILTNTNNIFSSPEFAFGADGKTWLHLGAHLFGGTTVGSLVPWLLGSAILAVTKKLAGRTHRQRGAGIIATD